MNKNSFKYWVQRATQILLRWTSVITCFVCAGLLFYALISHHVHAPSLFFRDSAAHVTQSQWLLSSTAALLFFLFGIGAWLVPALLIYSALIIAGWFDVHQEYERIAAWSVLLCTISLWGAQGADVWWHNLHLFGGLLGTGLSFLVLAVDQTVLHVCLAFVTAAAWILVTRLFFFRLFVHTLRTAARACRKQSLATTISKKLQTLYKPVATGVHRMLHPARKTTYDKQLVDESLTDNTLEHIVHDIFWQNYNQQTKQPAPKQQEILISEKTPYTLPTPELFARTPEKKVSSADTQHQARILQEKLAHFGVHGAVRAIKSGPLVTCFEYEPAIDTKVSKIVALEQDLALALQALSVRIVAPIPGTSVVGFEVARADRQTVYFSSLMREQAQDLSNRALPLLIGVDIVGAAVIADLARLPHLLIAGSTGSGKSVALHSMILSLLCAKTPDELKLVMIDPKRLELSFYADIAHLLVPVVTENNKTLDVLNWVIQTMHERYEHMAHAGVRNIAAYHALGEAEKAAMPYLVIIIDELADLMMAIGARLEMAIARITQMARAAGIHVIVATQRPSVDVITGIIKVNFASRLALRVTSAVDSRVILDEDGAQHLVGAGDMLMRTADASSLKRIHGAYCTNDDIARIVSYIQHQQAPTYHVIQTTGTILNVHDDSDEELYKQILAFLQTIDEVSISLLQRRFKIGFNRSARIIDTLETAGHIISTDGGKTRKVVRS